MYISLLSLNLDSPLQIFPRHCDGSCIPDVEAGVRPVVNPFNFIVMDAQKALIVEYTRLFNEGKLDALTKLFTEDALVHGVLGWGSVQEVLPIWEALVDGLGIQLHIEDLLSENQQVVARMTETGISRAPFLGHPATGHTFSLLAMEWFQIQDGKIHRRWGARDASSQARQLGWDQPAQPVKQ